jgi:hypothetical protein
MAYSAPMPQLRFGLAMIRICSSKKFVAAATQHTFRNDRQILESFGILAARTNARVIGSRPILNSPDCCPALGIKEDPMAESNALSPGGSCGRHLPGIGKMIFHAMSRPVCSPGSGLMA